MSGRGRALLKLSLLVALVAGGAAAAALTPVGDYLSREGIGEAITWLRGSSAAPLVYVIVYTVATALAIPGSVLTLAGGAMFGVFWGTIYTTIGANLGPGQPVYVLLYAVLIIFFCFFYTALVFNSKETADNLKRSGAFVPGIRPGAHTAEYIDKVLTRLTFWGAIYIAGVCLLPEIFRMFYPSVPFNFGGTSLLILVVVTMDFMAQMQAHAMSHQYEGMMKKANLRHYGRSGQLR